MIFIQRCGYKVIKANALNNYGIEEVKNLLKNNATAFAGQSGVRKVNSYK